MIVPRSRLLLAVALVTLPLSLLVAARPGALAVSALIAALMAVAAIIDAVAAGRSVAEIGINLPAIVRMSRNREARIDVRIENKTGRRRALRIALGLPRDIVSGDSELDVILQAGAPLSQMNWVCTPTIRGNYRIQSAYVEGNSFLGLWSARREIAVQCEVRVYPDLFRERKNMASIFLNRGASGVHTERQVGQGRDFEKLREYIPGDSFDEIHWKATARRGKPVTKIFQIERTQQVYVAIDASRLSARQMEGATDNPVLERHVTAALLLGLAAEQQGDMFGLLTFADKVESFIRAGIGKAHYGACRDALYTLQPRIVTPDFDEVCTFIRLRLRRRALIIFLTSLDDPSLAESFVRNVELLRRQHIVLVLMIRQPGTQSLFSDPDIEDVNDLYRHLGGHLRWQKLRQLEKTLQRRGVRLSLVENERLSADLVAQYMNVKQRQLI